MSTTSPNIATSLLPAATVTEAPNGELPKKSALITVNIEPHEGNPLDAILLILNGIREDGMPYHWTLPPRPTGNGPIIFRLINERDIDIENLKILKITYEIITQQGTHLPSETLHLNVVTEKLPRVDIVEAPAPEFVFDPKQSLFDATIIARTHPDFIAGRSVWLHFEGGAAEGSFTKEFPIEFIWEGKDLYFTVDRAIVLANLNGPVKIYYTLVDGQSSRCSEVVEMWVGSALQLPVPEILEATLDNPATATIDPMKVLELGTFTLRVRNPDMLGTDEIEAYVKGTPDAGTPVIPPKYGDAVKRLVDFYLDINVIAANLGQNFTASYKYTRGSRSKLSDVLQVKVLPLLPSAMDLVKVPGAVDGKLDPRDSHAVQISEFPFMRTGLAVWIFLEGNQGKYTLRDGVPVSQLEFDAKRIEQLIPADYLNTLPHDEVVKVIALVSLNATGEISSAVPFVVREYHIAREPKVIATIAVGTSPTQVEVSIDGGKVFVANSGSQSISVIDTKSNTVIHTIPRPRGKATTIAVHPRGQHLYGCDNADSYTYVYNTNSYEMTHDLDGLTGTFDMKFSTDGENVYNANNRSVRRFRALSENQLAVNDIDSFALALCPRNTCLYSVHPSSDDVLVLDANDLQIIERIPASASQTIALTQTNAHSPYLYCGGSKLVIIDTATNTVIGDLITRDSVRSIATHPSMPLAYVVSGNFLLIINTNTHEIIQEIWVGGGAFIAITPDGSKAYISQENSNTVVVVAL